MTIQIIGLVIAAGVAIAAWGLLGFLGWLAVVMYMIGEELTPAAPEEPDTGELRGQ